MSKVDDRMRISAVPVYILNKTGELRSRRAVSYWTKQGLQKGGRTLRLKSEKICGIVYTRKSWVDKFIEEINR